MKVYHCDGPGCNNKCSPNIVNGWTKLKWSHYTDCSFHTGWFVDDVRYYCPDCSATLKGFLDPVKPNSEPIELTEIVPVAKGTFEPKKETEHYDKGYIWE